MFIHQQGMFWLGPSCSPKSSGTWSKDVTVFQQVFAVLPIMLVGQCCRLLGVLVATYSTINFRVCDDGGSKLDCKCKRLGWKCRNDEIEARFSAWSCCFLWEKSWVWRYDFAPVASDKGNGTSTYFRYSNIFQHPTSRCSESRGPTTNRPGAPMRSSAFSPPFRGVWKTFSVLPKMLY